MAFAVYTGLMGSGKTYEVVSSVILPALLKGRRVVSNIDGLDYEKIKIYLLEQKPDAIIGELLSVTNQQIESAGFFPVKNDDYSAIVRGGDIVCIDEAWRFFGTSTKIRQEIHIFLREHRHFTHPKTRVACDLVLMVQSIGDLHRNVKSVVELSFRTHKLKTVGLDRRYRLDMFEGSIQRISMRANTWQKAYDPAIYSLYSSYAAGSGKELAIDDRQNILKDPRNLLIALGVLVIFAAGFYGLSHIYYRYKGAQEAAKDEKPSSVAPTAATAASRVGTGPVPSAPLNKVIQSADWRLAGRIVTVRGERAVLAGQSARLRVEDPALFVGHGWDKRAMLDGEQITAWSGPVAGGFAATSEQSSSVMSVGK